MRHNDRAKWAALVLLTLVNLLNYIDRIIFSALLPAIKDSLHFTDTQLGLLGSGFIVAYLLISPLFGFLGDRGGRSKVMAMGLGVWSAATAVTGVATTYLSQMATRIAVGLGESAYSVIAPSVIADHFPKRWRGKVFAVYSGAMPIGCALGYLLGGWLEPRIGWQRSFFVVGVPGMVLAFFLFISRDPRRGQSEATTHAVFEAVPSFFADYKSLFTNGGFLSIVLGYAAYTFVVGGMAFWMPSYIVRYFDVRLSQANIYFGAVTVIGGFVGTLLGGWWADGIERKSGNGYLKVSIWSMIFAVPLFVGVLRLQSFNDFMLGMLALEIAIFLCISPLDAAVIGYVRPGLRSSAMALNVFLIHLLGDGISRTLMGAVSDASELRSAILILPWVLGIGGVIWLLGLVFWWQPLHWPERGLRVPKWQAHRGYRPEKHIRDNSLEAFKLAAISGAEAIECDVHLAKDGEVVVFHDFDLKKSLGRPERVKDLTSKQLAELVGAPLLRDLLLDRGVPRIVNVEIKSNFPFGTRKLVKAIVRVVHETGAIDRVMFSSFNPFALRQAAKLAPEFPRGLLAASDSHIWNRRLWLAFLARPHLVHLEHVMITPERAASLKARGIPLVAWTVNDPMRANVIFGLGVDSVISDNLFARS